MPDPSDELSAVGVAGALATNYARDARTFLPMLATVLQSSMPAETTLFHRGALFSKQKTVCKVRIETGDFVYVIEDAGNGRLVATRTHSVRGIQLKHESLAVQPWLTALAVEIAATAKTNEQAYFALKNALDYTIGL